MQACLTTISLALCKVGHMERNDYVVSNFLIIVSLISACCFSSCNILQAFDLLDMLKKEEEMLSAIREKQLQVLMSLIDKVDMFCALDLLPCSCVVPTVRKYT